MVRVRATQKTDLGLVIFANSITLTPGTISIDLEDDGYILVHAISKEGTEGLEGGEMDRRVTSLEGTSYCFQRRPLQSWLQWPWPSFALFRDQPCMTAYWP